MARLDNVFPVRKVARIAFKSNCYSFYEDGVVATTLDTAYPLSAWSVGCGRVIVAFQDRWSIASENVQECYQKHLAKLIVT